MKIVFVAPFGLGQKTTVWARILPLAKIIANAPSHAPSPAHSNSSSNNQVYLLIPPWDTPKDSGKRWVEGGVTIQNVQLEGGLPFICWRLLSAVWTIQPDVVHIVKPRAYAGIIQWILWNLRWFAGSKNRMRILLDIDDWEQAWNEMNNHGWLLSRFLSWQEEWGIRHADGITAASLWLTAQAQCYAPTTPLLYLPNGVKVPTGVKAPQEEKQRREAPLIEGEGVGKTRACHQILYLTRYVEITPEWLAHFWQSISTRVAQSNLELPRSELPQHGSSAVQRVELVVAGGPLQPHQESVFRQAFESKVQLLAQEAAGKECTTKLMTSVQWLGLVDKAEIAALYNTATCAIFPAAEVPLQQAKCSVRMATTLLYGLPVVASAVGQQTEYGANGAARLVPADATPERFADAVYEMLEAPTTQVAISTQASTQLLRSFSWEKFGTSLHEFYKEVV